MTNEEREDAIKFFTEVSEKEVNNAKYSRLAIEALEQQPCENCISRVKAIEEADKLCLETDYDNEKVIEMLNDLPPVTPKEKTGHWIFKNDNIAILMGYYQCSECGEGKVLHKDNFCPNCGCRMVEPQESEDKG